MARPQKVVAAIALVALMAPAVPALDFQTRQIAGRRVLIMVDCDECGPPKDQFRGKDESYPGDAAILRALLRDNRFDEIWMISGGGNLFEGVRVGRVLREYGATVRVPAKAVCASSCTVAFMGGLFRYLDENATFEVHAASSVKDGIPELVGRSYQEGGFEQVARDMRVNARFNAIRLLRHFQNTLLQSRRVTLTEDDERFWNWAESRHPDAPDLRSLAEKYQERFDNEGNASLQDILMRIEREAMGWAIQDLRAVKDLGPRSGDAIAMIEAMYSVGIVDSAILTRETMYKMGYLTRDVKVESGR